MSSLICGYWHCWRLSSISILSFVILMENMVFVFIEPSISTYSTNKLKQQKKRRVNLTMAHLDWNKVLQKMNPKRFGGNGKIKRRRHFSSWELKTLKTIFKKKKPLAIVCSIWRSMGSPWPTASKGMTHFWHWVLCVAGALQPYCKLIHLYSFVYAHILGSLL